MKTNKYVDVVVGLQAGSEAKGKLISIMPGPYGALVRTGSVNAAHTSYLGNEMLLYHQLPCGSAHFPKAKIILGANAQIDLDYLKKEIQILKDHDCWLVDGKPRLIIDNNATIIDYADKVAENGGRMPDCGKLYFNPTECEEHKRLGGTCMGCEKLPKDSAWAKLGSTTHGSGANLIRKIARGTKMAILAGQPLRFKDYINEKMATGLYNNMYSCFDEMLEKDVITDWSSVIDVVPIESACENEFTKQFVGDASEYINMLIDEYVPVLLEGTQGAVLSLYHGYKNKGTSKDTNAANWCSEAGISPLAIRDIYGVARTYPIRVAGDSGPMSGEEITWGQLSGKMESPKLMEELTSATKRRRRIFRFGDQDFQKALNINRPTKLMLTFVDYLHYTDFGKSSWDDLTDRSRTWILDLEKRLGVYFNYLSTGPKQEDLIVR